MGASKGGDSKSKNTNTTVYPGDFLGGFENRYGRGINLNELAGMLPGSTSLFGGGGNFFGAGGQQATLPGGGGGAAPGGTVPWDAVNSVIQGQYIGQPERAAKVMKELRATAGPGATGITLAQLTGGTFRGVPQQRAYLRGQLPAQLEQFLQPQQQRFGAPAGPDISALGIPQSIQRLFGQQAEQQFDPYAFRDIPGITGATAQAGLMNVAPGGFDRYEDALFRSAYDPQRREIERGGEIADRRLQSELAGAGLGSSGAGVGQVQQQRADRAASLRSIASDTAYQATAQRFGQEFAQSQFNAQQTQTTNLENAGFNQDAQKQNAANVLAGDAARSENYLKTMGLNVESAKAMREDFMQLLGITQAELARLDASQMEKVGVLLNSWLQQGALLGNLGQRGTQKSSSSGGSGGGLTITGQGSTT